MNRVGRVSRVLAAAVTVRVVAYYTDLFAKRLLMKNLDRRCCTTPMDWSRQLQIAIPRYQHVLEFVLGTNKVMKLFVTRPPKVRHGLSLHREGHQCRAKRAVGFLEALRESRSS